MVDNEKKRFLDQSGREIFLKHYFVLAAVRIEPSWAIILIFLKESSITIGFDYKAAVSADLNLLILILDQAWHSQP